jgi:hypothetical protein
LFQRLFDLNCELPAMTSLLGISLWRSIPFVFFTADDDLFVSFLSVTARH